MFFCYSLWGNLVSRESDKGSMKKIIDCKYGRDCFFADFVNLYGCVIGDETKIGAFVEIQAGAVVGSRCKISSHTFICDGVTIGDSVFVGHGVVFINDKRPRATGENGTLETKDEWQGRFVKTVVEDGVSIGSNSTILGGITLGRNSIIGAGSVVTKNVMEGATVMGNPASEKSLSKQVKELKEENKFLRRLMKEQKERVRQIVGSEYGD
jgi:acetyltransferase-like isoleucine patch superfamily enzyme